MTLPPGPAETPPRIESRLPPALALAVLLMLIDALHDRYQVWPDWAATVAAILLWTSMAAVGLSSGARRWLTVERWLVLAYAMALLASALASLVVLITRIILNEPGADGLELLTSAVVIWACNLLGFALLFWKVDGGGEFARLLPGHRADWLFVEAANPAMVPPGWRPRFVDYLFLGFSTATAFSTTDTLPLTARAKLLMMAESIISLATLAVVASRAINVLGS